MLTVCSKCAAIQTPSIFDMPSKSFGWTKLKKHTTERKIEGSLRYEHHESQEFPSHWRSFQSQYANRIAGKVADDVSFSVRLVQTTKSAISLSLYYNILYPLYLDMSSTKYACIRMIGYSAILSCFPHQPSTSTRVPHPAKSVQHADLPTAWEANQWVLIRCIFIDVNKLHCFP